MKIDIVIPWVDGSDKEWLAVKNRYSEMETGQKIDNGDNRYRDWDNLKYVFRGIEKNLPWINKVFLITDGQLPDWINKDCPRLAWVRHEDYIPEKYLPTFSANPIELNLHRIPELSEHFVYINDDYFFINKCIPEDFFSDGLPCDYALEDPVTFNHKDVFNSILMNNMILLNSEYDRKEVLKKYRKKIYSMKDKKAFMTNMCFAPLRRNDFFGFHYSHLCTNLLKSTIETMWDKHYDVLDQTSSHRFRSTDDVNQYIFKNEQYVNGRFTPYNVNRFGAVIHLDDSKKENVKRACALIKDRNYRMVCINDHNIVNFEDTKKKINGALDQVLHAKSSFEK